jgi:hypothetical protein
MRNYINIVANAYLSEAQKPKKTRTRQSDPTFDPNLNQPPVPQNTPGEPPARPGSVRQPGDEQPPNINVPLSPQAQGHLGDLSGSGIGDEISDEEAARRAGLHPQMTPSPSDQPEPPPPENLPAVIRSELMAHGDKEFQDPAFNPKWIQVKHLPGYLQSAIRGLGRAVFSQFTDTPIEDIQVLSTLSNPTYDVKKMMAFIRKNGVRDDSAEIDFEPVMPGYSAKTQLWRMVGYDFLLVKDLMGYYIYSWPGGRGVHVGQAPEPRRLR